MAATNTPVETMRRSTRLRVEVPVRIRSLDPKCPFDMLSQTLIINAQGCGLQSSIEIPVGTPVSLATQDRVTSGRVLNSTAIDTGRKLWVVGVELDQFGNFWGVESPPADWIATPPTPPAPSTSAPPRPIERVPGQAHPFVRRAAPEKPEAQTKAANSPFVVSREPAAAGEDSRARFDALLQELNSRLQSQVSADWERWRNDAVSQLNAFQKQLGLQLAAEADRRLQETQKSAAELAELLKIARDPAPVLAAIESREAAFRANADQLSTQLSRQSEQAMAELRKQVEDLLARHESDAASRLAARGDDIVRGIHSGGDKLQALQAAADRAMEAIDQHRQEVAKKQADLMRAAESALENIDVRRAAAESAIDKATSGVLQKLNQEAEAGRLKLEERLQQQAWDYEAQAEAVSERLQNRLAAALKKLDVDIAEKQAALSSSLGADSGKVADEVRSALAAERDRHVGALREQIEEEFRRRSAEFQARHQAVTENMAVLEARSQQVSAELTALQTAKAQIESMMAALPESMRAQAREQATAAWDAVRGRSEKHIAETLQAESQRGATRLLDEITAAARHLREEMAEHAQQTAAQLQASLAEVLSERQQQVSQQMEIKFTDLQTRAAAVETAARSAEQRSDALAERLLAFQGTAEERSQALQKQLDDAQRWLGEHTAEFQKTVHDSFLQAGGEIRGRVHASVDSADEMIRQKSKDVMASVDSASAQHLEALGRKAAEIEAHIASIQANATTSAEAVLKSRLEETLGLFREDAARLAESALGRWRSAMDDTLRSIPDLLRTKLETGDKDPSR